MIIVLSILALIGCENDHEVATKEAVHSHKDSIHRTYLFLAHIYGSNNRVDPRIENLDLSGYDQIWLGGDILSETTKSSESVDHVDRLFNISSPSTHWALGNHDVRNGNVDLITNKTGRPTFYSTYFDGITLLILNTNYSQKIPFDPAIVNLQFKHIREVCDTITHSSHLVVLSHHAVWSNVDQVSNLEKSANEDHSFLPFNFDPDLRYADGVYPMLQKVQDRGVNVVHIAGDWGQNSANYQEQTSDGIKFIGSGISANTKYNEQFPTAGQPDSVLILRHNIDARDLEWHFEVLK